MSDHDKLNEIISCARNVVFFGGAGVSTESGVPDFRSADGLYNSEYKYPPETILSHGFFMNNTEEFYEFYKKKMIFPDAKPNDCHNKLAELEKKGVVKAVVTQNIDGLHQAAGSVSVLELHGGVERNFCMVCNKKYGLDKITESPGVPRCECGGVVKPDVVLYGETLNDVITTEAVRFISQAEVLIVGGTSLAVYPAAGLCRYFNGSKLIFINKTKTHLDESADLVIRDSIGEVFAKINY